MRLNNRVQREEKRETSAFRRAVPLVAGLAFSAALLIPKISQAQTHTCSAKVVNRPMTSFESHKTSKGKITGLTLYVSAGQGKRIEVQVPDSFVNSLAARSEKLPKDKRGHMVHSELMRTIEGAVATVNSSKRTFTCGSQAPRIKAPPSPAPAAAQTKSPPTKTGPAFGLREPLPPRKKGGNGTESSPYVIEIPVPAGTKKGTKITSTGKITITSVSQTGGKTSERMHFRLDFVTEPQSEKDYRSDPKKLSYKVASLMSSFATAHVRKTDPNAATVSVKTTEVYRQISSSAQNNQGTIGKYLGIEPSNQRRRTLGEL